MLLKIGCVGVNRLSKAWALREVWRADGKGKHGMLTFIASKLSWQQTMGSGCCETASEFESVWVHACVSGVITRRQFCVLLYGCSSCWESFARKAHSETLTCISRYIYPFAHALLGKFSRIDLHALACSETSTEIHKNTRGSEGDPLGILGGS